MVDTSHGTDFSDGAVFIKNWRAAIFERKPI
jgi:hypothetical protein